MGYEVQPEDPVYSGSQVSRDQNFTPASEALEALREEV
jgi:hypothetical protein